MGYELLIDDPAWCDDCALPKWTRGSFADVEAGLGSVWRCENCGRRWILQAHNHESKVLREARDRASANTPRNILAHVAREQAGIPHPDFSNTPIDSPAKWIPMD